MTRGLSVTFPPEWGYLSAMEDFEETQDLLLADAEALGTQVQDAFRAYFAALASTLRHARLAGLASLAHFAEDPDTLLVATCAVAFEGLRHDIDDPVADVALAGAAIGEPVIESSTTVVHSALGAGVRVSTIHTVAALATGDGSAPVVGQVRYAFPLDGRTALLLHFSTPSVVYLDELTALFDAIAATADRDGASPAWREAPQPQD